MPPQKQASPKHPKGEEEEEEERDGIKEGKRQRAIGGRVGGK